MLHAPIPVPADLVSILDTLTRILGIGVEDLRRTTIRIVLIWLLAWIAWRVLLLVARRIVAKADDGDDATLSQGEKRAETIAQLLRSVGQVVILLLAVLLTLRLFLDITPLLGGVAVLGLAVSFGAQSLIKDLLSGFFILVENQFTVGDVIDAGGKSGTVERMTLRVVMLRDLEGVLHIVPNGEITSVSNKTRGWARAVVDVGVGYDADVDQALSVIRDEAMKFAADPAWQRHFDGVPEVAGVQQLGDNAITIRVLFRTRPGSQWDTGREFRRRVKLRLDREGIDIPFPQRTVHVRYHGAPADRDPISGGGA